jgi:hypothetical protein
MTSLGYDILPIITQLRTNTNISDDWLANLTSSLYGNISMLRARGLRHFAISNTTLSCNTIA